MTGNSGDQRPIGRGAFRKSDGSSTQARKRWLRDTRPRCEHCGRRLATKRALCAWECQRKRADKEGRTAATAAPADPQESRGTNLARDPAGSGSE